MPEKQTAVTTIIVSWRKFDFILYFHHLSHFLEYTSGARACAVIISGVNMADKIKSSTDTHEDKMLAFQVL